MVKKLLLLLILPNGLFVRSTVGSPRGVAVVDRDRDDTRAIAKWKKRPIGIMPIDLAVKRQTKPVPHPSSNPCAHFFASFQPPTVEGRTLFKIVCKITHYIISVQVITLFLGLCLNFFVGGWPWWGWLGGAVFGGLDSLGDRLDRCYGCYRSDWPWWALLILYNVWEGGRRQEFNIF